MNRRDVEAQPGDNDQTELEGESLELGVEPKPLVMPQKADVSKSDQARRRPVQASAPKAAQSPKTPAARLVAPLQRSTGTIRPVAQARPVSQPAPRRLLDEAETSTPPPVRLSSPHPLSRLRLQDRSRSLGRSLGLGGLAIPARGATRPGDRWTRGRTRSGRPSLRALFGFAGLTATVAVVSALLMTLPNQPAGATPSGAVYGIHWNNATAPPLSRIDFGPYFTTLDNELLMVGTTNSTAAGSKTTISTTTVWATTDGSKWTQRSGSGAFGIDGRRFVAQGTSDDGQGGLVVVGNSIGSSPTDVVATAWHSRDGIAWTPMSVDSARGQEMVAGVVSRSGVVVAAGNGVAWLCTDGHSWSSVVLPGFAAQGGSYTMTAVGSWNGGFAIIGLWNGTGTIRSTAWYSQNGHDWSQAKTSLDGFYLRGIASLGGRIVAVGSDLSATAPGLAASWSSADGNTWTKTTAPTDLSTVSMDSVIQVGSSLVAFGAPTQNTATTGVQPGPTLPGSTPKPAVTEVMWVSDDGIEWVPVSNSAEPLQMARMAAIGNRVIMIGSSGSALAEVSGSLVVGPPRAHASQSAPPANFALMVQVGNSPMIPDVTRDYTLGPVTSTNDLFYLFATGPTGTSIFNSGDGYLWSQETGSDGLTKSVVAVQPIASGSAGQSLSSSPGHSASPGTSAQAGSSGAPSQPVVTGRPVVLRAIPDGNGGIIAVGKVTNTNGDNGMIWHMATAGSWQQVQFQDDAPPDFSSIAAGSGVFVASSDEAGGSSIMYSTDGNTWRASAISVGKGFALTVATYRFGFVAVGTDAAREGATTAWTSPDGRTWTLRTDWHLPPNVTALFGMGNALVATARTAAPVAAATPAPAATASAAASGAASVKPSAAPSLAPTATPAATTNTTTWWWSATGVTWQTSGLQTTSASWSIVDGQILLFDPPATATASATPTPTASASATATPPENWAVWSSADGKSWQHPSSNPVNFAGSGACTIAWRDDLVVVVGWDKPGVLKDYTGNLVNQ
jgi:hypothetical protein